MEIIRNEITVSQKHLKTLREEFKTSRQTVFNALKDFTQSHFSKRYSKKSQRIIISRSESN
ncbi:hypothetical protein PL371_08055 [Tenacibaculum maritimum]|nr:hypothetical protein [Tenacibaculum maritimum]MDB0611823.1 hypothetical protein [Tenacibaculum maritimum]